VNQPQTPWTRDTQEQARILGEHLTAILSQPCHLRVVPPLPRKLRARLWCDHQVDRFASWLVARGQWRTATWVWKAYGAW
jgi:hypothetical protein